jgi:hypothetical protein
MDGHQTLYVAFLGSLLSNLLILIWLAHLGATKAKIEKTLKDLLLNLLMDSHQTLYVAFIGSLV